MIKFLKYDFKGSYKTLLGFLFGGVFASTFLQLLLNGVKDINNIIPEVMIAITAIISVIVIASVVVGFILFSVRMFSNELNSDRGYLTMSVPKDMTQMVLSKLLIVFIWCLIYVFVGFFFNAFLMSMLSGSSIRQMITSSIDFSFLVDLIKVIVTIAMESTITMAICYLSITLSKITFNNKKLGLLWIPIFILLMLLLNYAKSILAADIFTSAGIYITGYNNGLKVEGVAQFYKIIAADIVIGAILVYITGKLLNKKVNL